MSETVETVVEFLKDAGLTVTRFYGDEIVAYCPWHEDTNASLAINVSISFCDTFRHITNYN